MRVLLSTCGSRREVDPMVGGAVQLRALGGKSDSPVATGGMPAGVWR
jgi:hypothetical protein